MSPRILVIDSNQIISSLIRDSITRKILLNPTIDFIGPDYLFYEIEKHKDLIIKKSGLMASEYDFIIGEIFSRIEIIPFEEILPCMDEAKEIMDSIDPDDTIFIAVALCTENDGIWTNDNHFLQQNRIKIWTTEDLVKILGI